MDFWSRLLGGATSSSSRALRNNVTGKRLSSFKQTCNTLYQIWRNAPTLGPDSPAIPLIRTSINRLNSILNDESRGPSPHPCHVDAASSQVYLTITKLALLTHDPEIISATAIFFNTLIETEVDGIVDSRIFSRALVDLVSHANVKADNHSNDIGVDGEAKLVELVFGVANIIRLRPEILPSWFSPKPKDGDELIADSSPMTEKEFEGATRRQDFPLFYLLVDYVHCKGRIGDFARTGLLYIIETAAKAKDLERWLIESDMATLMATGLGASYSQLSRLLTPAASPDDDMPPIVVLSDHAYLHHAYNDNPSGQLDAFLSYLLFWQDAVDHCKSPEVTDTLLDHFQVLFLEQLLYPSLLESSDVDGGSTSSVITYLCRILESIDQPDLVHRILHFLLATPAASHPRPKARMSLSRRKSLDLLTTFAEAATNPSPTLFNLVDLVLMGLSSRNGQTVVASLRLLTIIIQYHHQFMNLLIKCSSGHSGSKSEKSRTIDTFNSEIQRLFLLSTALFNEASIDESYEKYISSALAIINHRMNFPLLQLDNGNISNLPWVLDVNDRIFTGLLDLVRRFFSNTVLTNLMLTQSISALASSDIISLNGWLLDSSEEPEPLTKRSNGGSEQPPLQGDTGKQFKFPSEELAPTNTAPVLVEILRELVKQVDVWRAEVPDFDIHLSTRQHQLHRNNEELPSIKTENLDVKKDPTSVNRTPGSDGIEPGLSTVSPKMQALSITTPPIATDAEIPNISLCPLPSRFHSQAPGGDNDNDELHGSGSDSGTNEGETPKASLSHILTNVIILHEFILELTALVQVRASVLQDIQFTV
ncbi:hypothetical protein FQN57_005923 [Myotisia sp. PD_48]|nr:hypothetical protein FQN57_005923 [Myotisia sp. PD_48]